LVDTPLEQVADQSGDPRLGAGTYFCAIGWLQQFTAPSPPLVTMNSDPHFSQK